jgi:translation initiation factor IF-1
MSQQRTQMAKDKDLFEQEGSIVEILPNQMFKVELTNGHIVVCYTGGRMRQNKIRLVLGDVVTIEMSPYDLTKGRIIFRQ